jgi:hypothetical protein
VKEFAIRRNPPLAAGSGSRLAARSLRMSKRSSKRRLAR